MRPLFARAVAEHEALMAEAGAERYLRKDGWIKLYRSERRSPPPRASASWPASTVSDSASLDVEGAQALEPALAPVFRRAVHWPGAASVSNPLAVTRAYAARFAALGGVVLKGDVRSLHRDGSSWRIDTPQGTLEARRRR